MFINYVFDLAPTSVDAVTLKGEFDECVAPNQDLQKQDYAR